MESLDFSPKKSAGPVLESEIGSHSEQLDNSVFRREYKSGSVEDDLELFKGKTFYLDIYTNGNSADTFFYNSVLNHGGKISRRLGRHVTHLVWSEGRPKTISKALEFEDIKIISTLWFQETLKKQKLADEAEFKPIALTKMEEQKHISEIHDLKKGLSTVLNKKRTHADVYQAKLYEKSNRT